MRSTTLLAAVALVAAATVAGAATPTNSAKKGVPSPSELPLLGAKRSQGCFKSAGNMVKQPQLEFVAMGSCTDACIALNQPVAAVHGSDCYCGDFYPANQDRVDDKNCNYPCPSYPQEACGGITNGQYWGVFNNGLKIDTQPLDPSQATNSGPANPSATAPQSTVVVTQTSGAGSGGSNVGGIAAGVVCAIVAVGAIIGGVWFYLRRKRNKELQEEHHRNAAVSAFIHGGKPPSSSGGLSMTDSRMDPGMAANRRLSCGSIADNQDYSRKILRVTNA